VLVPTALRMLREYIAPMLRWVSARSLQHPGLMGLRAAISRMLRRGRWRRELWLRLHAAWWRWISPAPSR
jgi:hypothetical protein